MRAKIQLLAVVLCGIFGLASGSAWALPWDQDMYKQDSFKTNEIARSPAENTIPVGFTPFTLTTSEAAETLKNPVSVSKNSVWRGQRLWNANCSACHGVSGHGKTVVAEKAPAFGIPDLLTDAYRQNTDGKVFAVIYHGGANMPRYGFKLSHPEIWDLVNYLRFLQGTNVSGMKRPE